MPRQRMVKVEFFDSETLGMCSHTARLLFIGLWVMGDDNGNIKAQPRRIRMQVFPYDEIDDKAVEDALCELESVGCIRGYEADGERFINVPNFNAYQTIRKPSRTAIPTPPKTTSASLVRHWYATGDAPVRNQGGTSDEPVQHQCGTENARPGETSLVRHQDSTSDALVPHQDSTSDAQIQRKTKEGISPHLGDIPSPRLVGVATPPADGGADAEKSAPRRSQNEEARAAHDRMVAEAVPCPYGSFEEFRGGASCG